MWKLWHLLRFLLASSLFPVLYASFPTPSFTLVIHEMLCLSTVILVQSSSCCFAFGLPRGHLSIKPTLCVLLFFQSRQPLMLKLTNQPVFAVFIPRKGKHTTSWLPEAYVNCEVSVSLCVTVVTDIEPPGTTIQPVYFFSCNYELRSLLFLKWFVLNKVQNVKTNKKHCYLPKRFIGLL